jgi:photosystem II stability/assembly factor-like uncharacterized protein
MKNATEVEANPTLEGVITSGSKEITKVSSFAKVAVGTEISSAAFPANTHVVELSSASETLTVSNAATESKALAAITARNFLQNSSGGAETKSILLEAGYANVNLLDVELNVIVVTGTPKLVVTLESSVDNGKTWNAVEGLKNATEADAAFAEITAAVQLNQSYNIAGRATGPLLRLKSVFGANGGVAGFAYVATDN